MHDHILKERALIGICNVYLGENYIFSFPKNMHGSDIRTDISYKD